MATASIRPQQAANLVGRYIDARIPVLLTGAPGVGKSSIVEQAAKAAGYDVILSHPVVADPTDAKGLPWPGKDGESATFLPFGDLARAIKATTPTVKPARRFRHRSCNCSWPARSMGTPYLVA